MSNRTDLCAARAGLHALHANLDATARSIADIEARDRVTNACLHLMEARLKLDAALRLAVDPPLVDERAGETVTA